MISFFFRKSKRRENSRLTRERESQWLTFTYKGKRRRMIVSRLSRQLTMTWRDFTRERRKIFMKQQQVKATKKNILTVQCILAHYPKFVVPRLYKCSAYLLFFLRLNLNASFIKTIFFLLSILLIHSNLPRARDQWARSYIHIVNKLSNLKYAEIKSHFSGFLYLVLDVTLFRTLLRTRIFFISSIKFFTFFCEIFFGAIKKL